MEVLIEREVESDLIISQDHQARGYETETLLRIEKCRHCEVYNFHFVTLDENGESINVIIELEDLVETLNQIG